MKKILMLLVLILLFSCKEHDDRSIVTFWTNDVARWDLYVDDNYCGHLLMSYYVSTTDQIPNCGDNNWSTMRLEYGTHNYHMEMTISGQRFVTRDIDFIVDSGCEVVRCTQ